MKVSSDGPLVINQIILAETANYFEDDQNLDRNLAALKLVKEDLPWGASILAGLTHSHYRRAGGPRDRVLPDFLIGAHAVKKNYQLLTRDGARYRTYFPTLELIAPDTHP